MNADEVERIVEVAMLRLDLKYTAELSKLRQGVEQIPAAVDRKIAACREAGNQKRRWNFSAVFTVIMALVAAGSAVAANWP